MMRYQGVEATGGSLTLNSNAEIGFSFDLTGMGSSDTTTSAITGQLIRIKPKERL